MVDRLTTLVLGAGSSVGVGFPTGQELRLELCESIRHLGQMPTGIPRPHLIEFEHSFRDSGQLSIDAYLAKRLDMAEVGKKAIAALLIRRQREERLTLGNTDPWQQWLVAKLTVPPWEELSFQNLAIVTFNYDVSLEQILLRAMEETYRKPRALVVEKLRQLPIVHVYGSLGNVFSERDPWPYGSDITPEKVAAAAGAIKVIPEGRDEDESLRNARTLLLAANDIAFLGFGFDKLNLKRLAAESTCTPIVLDIKGHTARRIVGTCKGMTQAECRSMLRELQISPETASINHFGTLGEFYPVECLPLLRETLVISR